MADGYELGWDAAIEKDSPEFILLPEGDYEFTVTKFERGRHNDSEKLPACNKAVLSISIETPEGTTIIQHNLFLHSITEGMLSSFFTAIGQKKKGERVIMNWNAVVGAKGKCKVYIEKWQGKSGEEMKNNKIKKFYEPDETTTANGGFTPGRF